MSQITRCPSCSTTFKVVADQLRISEGWVRCGQCKEVFDASAHLLPAPAPALLPDVSLTDVRPPPAPVARKDETVRAWGAPPPSPPSPPPVPVPAPAPAVAAASAPQMPPADEPVLDVPDPAVPAFLSAGAGNALAEGELRLEPLAPFAWRARSSSLPAPVSEPSALPPAPPTTTPPASPAPAPAVGYELPAADLPDLDEDELDMPSFEETRPATLDLEEYPPLELPPPRQPPAPAPQPDVPVRAEVAAAPRPAEVPPPVEPVAAALPSVDFPSAPEPPEPEALALVDDDSPAAVLQASARKMSRGSAEEENDGEPPTAEDEVSFVVAARRKAFWRRPAVRAVLLLVLLLGVAALALQVAVQERDRIAAMDARARPWLERLCVPLHCKIAPPRQIDNVVIDSSSFNKARGDSYQLALTVKSRAAIPLAMPAVELTLTDAQDQPVLRRVLQPADLGAPAALPARGEWSTAVSVIVTTGGARVAGYRLLVFYP